VAYLFVLAHDSVARDDAFPHLELLEDLKRARGHTHRKESLAELLLQRQPTGEGQHEQIRGSLPDDIVQLLLEILFFVVELFDESLYAARAH
jgi:hypothetical protein